MSMVYAMSGVCLFIGFFAWLGNKSEQYTKGSKRKTHFEKKAS